MRVGEDEDVSLGVCLHHDANLKLPCPIRSSTRCCWVTQSHTWLRANDRDATITSWLQGSYKMQLPRKEKKPTPRRS